MKIYSIYRITNTVTSKVYIGFASNCVKRKSSHKKAAEGISDTKFYRAIRKYGWENFVFETIYQSLDFEHTLRTMENYFIVEHDSFKNGYNSTLGGDGAVTVSGDSHHMKSHEQRTRQGNSVRGKNNPIHKVSDQKRKEIISGLFTVESMKKKSGISHYSVDKTLYRFKNKKTGEIVISTKYELAKKYNLIQNLVSKVVNGDRQSTGGWEFLP
jgi:group I intron endonuclease